MRLSFTACVFASLLIAAPANAATTTVSRVGTAFTVVGDAGANRVVGGDYTDAQFTDDAGGTVIAGAGCTQTSATFVDCGTYPAGATVTVTLGAGDDYYKRATISYPQTIDGGDGNDTIETGNGNDLVRGGAGNDDLTGGRGDDTMDGGDGDDKVDGWDGSDVITGGAGRDNLLGDGATLYSGGNDTIYARDSEVDTVDCGGGADRAEIDGVDAVTGCATVDRPVATGPQPAPTPTPSKTPDAPLNVTGSLTQPRKLGALAAGARLGVTLTANATCTTQVGLAITKSESKRLKLGTKAMTLGTSTVVTLPAATPTTISVAVAAKYRARLRRATKLNGTLILVCADASNRTYAGQLPVHLGR